MEKHLITHENADIVKKAISDYKSYKESLPNIVIPKSFKQIYGYDVEVTESGAAYIVYQKCEHQIKPTE